MLTNIIDGKKLAGEREKLLKIETEKLTKKIGRRPKLVAVELADDEGSKLYLKLKKAAAERIGIEFETLKRSDLSVRQGRTFLDIDADGIFIQHPRGYDKKKWRELVDRIPPEKDVDCLTSDNLRLIKEGRPRFLPATVKAVWCCLAEAFGIKRPGLFWKGRALSDNLAGKRFVILGRSPILGLPLYHWFKNLGANVTLLHSQSTISPAKQDLASPDNYQSAIRGADILISCVGKPGLVTGNMVKERAVVIDCGSPVGDVVFSEVAPKALAITPVPGGIGPLTVVSLMENVIKSAKDTYAKKR